MTFAAAFPRTTEGDPNRIHIVRDDHTTICGRPYYRCMEQPEPGLPMCRVCERIARRERLAALR